MNQDEFIASMIMLLAEYKMISRCKHLEEIYETCRLSLMIDSMGALHDDGKLTKKLKGILSEKEVYDKPD